MKNSLVLVLAIACIISVSCADKRPGPDAAVVKVLDKSLPSEAARQERFLWNSFANKPDEQKFEAYTTVRWRKTYEAFATALVKKAGDQKLDATSLRKALDLVLKDSKDQWAFLPVGAYQTTLDGKLVWIVVLKWENPDKSKIRILGHICAFVFDQQTLKQLGSMSCG